MIKGQAVYIRVSHLDTIHQISQSKENAIPIYKRLGFPSFPASSSVSCPTNIFCYWLGMPPLIYYLVKNYGYSIKGY